jgi:undecaprenyl-diphosphatase
MLEAIFLGIIQGLTEFLPISSSAHIRILGEFLPSAQDPGATFTAIMQIGTEIAVLIFFRNDIVRIVRAAINYPLRRKTSAESDYESKLALMIVIGSLPIFIAGFLAQDYIRNNFRSLWLIASTLIVFGLILGIADHRGRKDRNLEDLTVRHGLAYGVAQSLALIPGVSRSGATIAMGRLLGYRREAALRYSFLLAIPAVLGSGAYELLQAIQEPTSTVFSLGETFVATVVAFITGYAVIAWLMKFVQTKSFMPFVIYRITLGTIVLVLLATGAISA